MTRTAALCLCLALTGCAGFNGVSDIVSACRTYETVAAVLKVGAWLHPAAAAAVKTITAQVDPVCAAVLAGQPAPAGITAQWVSQRTLELEDVR